MLTSSGEGLKRFSIDWTLLNHVVEEGVMKRWLFFVAKVLALVGSVSVLRFMTGQEDAFTVEMPIFFFVSVVVTVTIIAFMKVKHLLSSKRKNDSGGG